MHPAPRAAWRAMPLLALLFTLFIAPLLGWSAESSAQLRNANDAVALQGVPGERFSLKFTPASLDALGATLTVLVFSYDATGRLNPSPAATYFQDVDPGQQGRAVSVPVTLTRPGFYRAQAELYSRAGTLLGRAATTFTLQPTRRVAGLPGFGVVTHFAQLQGSPAVLLPMVQRAGFSWIRDELYWQEIEKTPGRFRFPPPYDAYLKQAAQLGIAPLVVLDYGNPRAYPAQFGKASFPQTPEARQRFVGYVEQVVKRYGSLVKHWELWNEPSFDQISYATYGALLKAVYPAIKALSPAATVIACGGGGIGGGPGADCPIELVKAGALDYQDGFSVHPYMSPNTPERGYAAKGGPIDTVSIPTTWPYLKSVGARYSKKNGTPLQVWITEYGWPVDPKVPGQDEASQAGNLVRSYLMSRRADSVRVLFWYDFMDDGTDPNNIEHNFGLLHHDMSPKPAFVAASVLAATLGSRPWRNALADGDVKVYRYATGDDAVTVGWTVSATPGTASIDLPPGRYVERDWQGVETAVTVTSRPFLWQLGPLPRYLLPVRAVPSRPAGA